MTVSPGNATPVISLQRGLLIVNGEEKGMTPASSSPYGMYSYSGNVPHDGEIRFRYLFRYFTGVSGASGPNMSWGPGDRYLTKTVGKVAWSSSREFAVPDNVIEDPFWRRPRRYIGMLDVLPIPNFSGTRTQTANLILTNNDTVNISVGYPPTVFDRSTGAAIPGFTISPASTIITILGGASATYTLTAQTSISNGQPVFWDAGVRFPVLLGATACHFGPIWVDVSWVNNPD